MGRVQNEGDLWVNTMRGNLFVVAVMINTLTYQFAFNPPGASVP